MIGTHNEQERPGCAKVVTPSVRTTYSNHRHMLSTCTSRMGGYTRHFVRVSVPGIGCGMQPQFVYAVSHVR
jgi:hypothetical protein